MTQHHRYLRWDAALVTKLAQAAADGLDKVEIAGAFGCSPEAIRFQATKHGVAICALKNRKKPGRPKGSVSRSVLSRSRATRPGAGDLRERWSAMLPAMKAALRAEI